MYILSGKASCFKYTDLERRMNVVDLLMCLHFMLHVFQIFAISVIEMFLEVGIYN